MNARREALIAALRHAGWKFAREANDLAALLERAEEAKAGEWGTVAKPSPGHRPPSGPERTPEAATMTPDDYRLVLEKLDLTAIEAAEALGVSRSQSFRYANGSTEVPATIVKLLNAYLRYGLAAGV